MISSLSAEPLQVLYFTKSAGWEHSVVKWEDGEPGSSYSDKVLRKLGDAHQINFTFSKDGSRFSEEYLKQFDLVMFYTSGDLLNVGTDGHPAMTEAGKGALLEAVRDGLGFVGVHSASDTFHTHESGGGNPSERQTRYTIYGENADPFIQLLGGEFINHGPQQEARATVVDPEFPGFADVGEAIEVREEWYSLKEFAPDLHTLLIMQTEGMEGVDYERPPFPIAWARTHGEGRVWYHAMGHREDVWDNEDFQAMLLGGIEWAGGRRDADPTPNLEATAPEADTLPPPR